MLLDIVVGPEMLPHHADQLLRDGVGLRNAAAREGGLIEENFAANNLVDPCFIDLQLPQRFGQIVDVAAGDVERGRALQHGDMLAVCSDRRNERRRRRARADDDNLLVLVVEVLGPLLGVNETPLEGLHARPIRVVALVMPVIALAHPEEIRGEGAALVGVGADRLDGP